MTDYKALNAVVRQQKATLTRAINSGDPERVRKACREAVQRWNTPGMFWPDDWSRWQRALDDALGYGHSVQLDDLA